MNKIYITCAAVSLFLSACNVNRVTPRPLRTATPSYHLTPQVTLTPVVIIVTATPTITATATATPSATVAVLPTVTGTPNRAGLNMTLAAVASPTRIYAQTGTSTATP